MSDWQVPAKCATEAGCIAPAERHRRRAERKIAHQWRASAKRREKRVSINVCLKPRLNILPVAYVLLGRQRRHNDSVGGSAGPVLGQCWRRSEFSVCPAESI